MVSSHLQRQAPRRSRAAVVRVFQRTRLARHKWSWPGCEACNDYSIGIRREGADETPYADAQYAMLRGLIPLLLEAYPAITRERIVGHSDVAPGRKTDPGALRTNARRGTSANRCPPARTPRRPDQRPASARSCR